MEELRICNTAIFNINGVDYAFDKNTYEIMKLTKNQKEIFKYLIQNKTLPTDFKLTKDLLYIVLKIKEGIFFTKEDVNYGKVKQSDAYIISFPVVHKCNLKCKYCFAQGGEVYYGEKKEMEVEVLQAAFRYLEKHFNLKKIRLEFVSGGEPFLDKDRFKELIDCFKNEIQLREISEEIFVETNGTLIEKEILEYIRNNNISLGISLDGEKEVHDYQRPYSHGKGTYDDILKNIKKNYKNGGNLWILSVITSKTKCLSEILEHHRNFGASSIEMRVVRGNDKWGLSLAKDNFEHFCKLYNDFSLYLKNHIKFIKYIFNSYDTFGKILVRLITGNKIIYRCQAARNKLSITAEGDLYPCDSFVGIKEMRIGNVYNGDLNNDIVKCFEESSVIINSRCSKCLYKYLCGGECYYDKYIMNGKVEHNTLFCEFQQHLIKLAIDLVYFIKTEHYEEYKLLHKIAHIRNIQEMK